MIPPPPPAGALLDPETGQVLVYPAPAVAEHPWRRAIGTVALVGGLLSVGLALVPWGLFYLIQWIGRGFARDDRC
jgi:hypothetical protein